MLVLIPLMVIEKHDVENVVNAQSEVSGEYTY